MCYAPVFCRCRGVLLHVKTRKGYYLQATLAATNIIHTSQAKLKVALRVMSAPGFYKGEEWME